MGNDNLNIDINKDMANKSRPFEILLPCHMQVLNTLSKICGKAEPNSNIKIRLNTCPMQETKADNNGDWCISLGFSLPEGCHVVFALSSQNTNNTGRSCFIINKSENINKTDNSMCESENPIKNEDSVHIKEDEANQNTNENTDNEPKIPLPIELEMPVILYPLNTQTITGEFKIIRGKAKPGNIVTVCIRGLTCCTALADDFGDFTAILESPLKTGNYTATAFQADKFGNRSPTASNTFFII